MQIQPMNSHYISEHGVYHCLSLNNWQLLIRNMMRNDDNCAVDFGGTILETTQGASMLSKPRYDEYHTTYLKPPARENHPSKNGPKMEIKHGWMGNSNSKKRANHRTLAFSIASFDYLGNCNLKCHIQGWKHLHNPVEFSSELRVPLWDSWISGGLNAIIMKY